MIYRFALVLIAFTFFPPVLADDNWPSEAQIELVQERKKSFPVERFIYDIDWFSPLETVPGAKTHELLVNTKNSTTIEQAISLVEKHDSYAFVYWQGGAIRAEKYWYDFNAKSRFDTASMHKTVVALLLGIAQQQGLIDSVDDPIENYLPELAGTRRGAITLRAMLEMASGIVTPPFSSDPANPYFHTYYGDDLEQAIAHWPMDFEPFKKFYYANANTQYLAWVIERTSKMRYAQFLSKYLWQRIGAGDARLWLDREGGSADNASAPFIN